MNNAAQSVRRKTCSVTEYFYLKSKTRNALPGSLSPFYSPGERWTGGMLAFFSLLKLENLHSWRMSAAVPEASSRPSGARMQQQGLFNQLHIAEILSFCWMLYRRNCNPLLSSSLQRCYVKGVCFAFQLAALWVIKSHPNVKQELELGRDDLTPLHTHIRNVYTV